MAAENKQPQTAFSFEILPPLKGNSIQKVYNVIDKLREFNPQHINITSHHSEFLYKNMPDGSIKRVNVRKRPGSVAIAAAIQNKYGITAVPHIICKGFTKEETEYALIDLNFLGVHHLLLLRGDAKGLDSATQVGENFHNYATDLQKQVNDFNKGIALDGSTFDTNGSTFIYGMACYPEKHEEAPNLDLDISYAKQKVEQGASYLVTQMFFDNQKYFDFVNRLRNEGITVPIIPGIKPIVFKNQLNLLPKIFRTDIPEPLATELMKSKDDAAAKQIGTEWCIEQCRELIAHGIPSLHFYTMLASDSVKEVAKEIY